MGREALTAAISSEIRARDLYREVSGRIVNRRGKRRMERLARDEEGHRVALAGRFRALFGGEPKADPGAPGGPRFDFVKSDIFSKAGALEVVSVAISAETESATFYGKQLESVTDPGDVKLLRRLVKFEQGHKKRLQREYERLSRGASWAS